jgi:hypothetical protein
VLLCGCFASSHSAGAVSRAEGLPQGSKQGAQERSQAVGRHCVGLSQQGEEDNPVSCISSKLLFHRRLIYAIQSSFSCFRRRLRTSWAALWTRASKPLRPSLPSVRANLLYFSPFLSSVPVTPFSCCFPCRSTAAGDGARDPRWQAQQGPSHRLRSAGLVFISPLTPTSLAPFPHFSLPTSPPPPTHSLSSSSSRRIRWKSSTKICFLCAHTPPTGSQKTPCSLCSRACTASSSQLSDRNKISVTECANIQCSALHACAKV